MNNPAELRTNQKVTWCPGCGDYGVLEALCQALYRVGRDPAQTVLVAGNGCSGMIGFFVKTYAIQGVYGRTLPVALGVKLANPSLNVIVAGGDGDVYAAGVGHLIHVARKNPDLTCLIMDNGCYGLTGGQPSPTARWEAPAGKNGSGQPVTPLALLITAGVTFVAQGHSEDPHSLSLLIEEAFNHRGLAVINILSPCTVFNKQEAVTLKSSNLVHIDTASHRVHDRLEALRLAMAQDSRLRVGVFYQEDRPTILERINSFSQRKEDLDAPMRLERIIDTMKP